MYIFKISTTFAINSSSSSILHRPPSGRLNIETTSKQTTFLLRKVFDPRAPLRSNDPPKRFWKPYTSLLTFPQNKNLSASRSPITATVYQFDTKHHTVKSIGRSVALYIHKRHVKLACLCGCFLTLTFCYHCVVEYWWVVPPTSYLAENFCMMPTPNGCELGCCRGCRARWIYPQNDRRRRSKWYLAKVGKKRYCESEVYKPAPESFIIGKEN